MSRMAGGISNELKEADEVCQQICNELREEIEAKTGRKFAQFIPLGFKTQLVNGVNYFVKVKVDEKDDHIHVRAHRSFQGQLTLHSVQEKKTVEEELAYF